MPCATLPPRAVVFRLAALFAVACSIAYALGGASYQDSLRARCEPISASAGHHHGRYVDFQPPSSVQTPDDRDDDDERWKKDFQLGGIAAACSIGGKAGSPSTDLLRLSFSIPPRGPSPPRLRC